MDVNQVSNVLENPGCKEKYNKLIEMQLEETKIGRGDRRIPGALVTKPIAEPGRASASPSADWRILGRDSGAGPDD